MFKKLSCFSHGSLKRFPHTFTNTSHLYLVLFYIFRYSCNMLFGCTGYYSYENPYQPHFPGQENFIGPIVHPQKWNEEHDQQILGKKVAIIGSGATAVTILPSIADQGYFSSKIGFFVHLKKFIC